MRTTVPAFFCLSLLGGWLSCTDGSSQEATPVVLSAATDNIVTVAGEKAAIGDGQPATSALLNLPGTAVCYTSRAGEHVCFIGEGAGNRVRRVDASGTITTFAGTGGSGWNGDGIPAIQAQLSSPRGLLVRGDDLYIVEFAGHRVRKVSLAADIPVITTVAGTGVAGSLGDGGPATEAQLNGPGFVAIDAAGNLYVTEVSGLKVRKVDPAGTITTIAGTGVSGAFGDGVPASTAQFVAPNGLAIDAAGNLYVADTNNSCVRKIDLGATPPTIATVAGACGMPGTSPDGVPAREARLGGPRTISLDAAGTLYIAEFGTNKIRKIDEAGTLRTVAGTGERGTGADGDGGRALDAKLNGPNFAFFDADGSFYIAESLGQRVRRVDPSGIIRTFAGGGNPMLGDDGPATTGRFFPSGRVAFDSAGSFYIADLGNNRVRKVTRATGLISTFAGTGVSGSLGDGGKAIEAQLSGPAAVAVDPAGNVYIADSTSRRIRKVAPDGTITRFAGTGASLSGGDGGPAVDAQVNNPNGLAVDCAGNLYISEMNGNRVRKVDAVTHIISLIAGDGSFGFGGDGGPATAAKLNAPVGLAADCAGNVTIADTGNNRVRRVDAVTHVITTVAGNGVGGSGEDGVLATATPLELPVDVQVDEAGKLWIADAGHNRIRTVDGSGIIRTIAGNGVWGFTGDGGLATGTQLSGPRGVAVDPAGNVYVTDSANTRIRRLNLATTVTVDPRHFDLAREASVWLHVQLPAGWDARKVALGSVVLQAIDPASGALRLSASGEVLQTASSPEPEGLLDTNGDGVADHMILKFDRATVASWVSAGSQLALRVEGQAQPPAGWPVGRIFSGDVRP